MQGFIEELRHRNVIRVGVAYVVMGEEVTIKPECFNDIYERGLATILQPCGLNTGFGHINA